MPRKFTFTTQVYDKKTDFPQTGDVDVIYIDASKNIAYRYDDSYYTISSAEVDIWGAMGSLSKGGGGGGGGASWGDITGTLSDQTDLNTALSAKQNTLTLTTTGTSGAATLVDSTLNIPQYSGGGGIHALLSSASGHIVSNNFSGAGFGSTLQIPNRIVLSPFIPSKTFTSSNFLIRVFGNVAPSMLSKILIYSDLNGRPNTLLYQSADLDCSTTGTKTALNSFSFTAGQIYWLGYWSNSNPQIFTIAAANMYCLRNQGAIPNPSNIVSVTITYGSAPTTITGTTESLSTMPFIGITQA
jgi:hypothetical protein